MINQTLHVYISDACWTCRETRRIVADIAPQFPELTIELRDASQDWPDEVFAVPTYVLNGRVIFLGNPTRKELSQKLTSVRQTA